MPIRATTGAKFHCCLGCPCGSGPCPCTGPWGQVQEVLVLVLVLGGQVLVLVLGGQVLVLVLGGQVLVNIPGILEGPVTKVTTKVKLKKLGFPHAALFCKFKSYVY